MGFLLCPVFFLLFSWKNLVVKHVFLYSIFSCNFLKTNTLRTFINHAFGIEVAVRCEVNCCFFEFSNVAVCLLVFFSNIYPRTWTMYPAGY
jgi:hypothetical protein